LVEHAHISTEHIDELREILDTGVSEELANLRRLTHPDRFRASRILDEASEFQHLKSASAPPDAGVPDEDGTRAFRFDRERDADHQGCADRE